jgi:signal transduction histidine kinase
MNLKEKLESLQQTTAFPTKEDYQFLIDSNTLVKEVNSILEKALEEAKATSLITYEMIAKSVFVPLLNLDKEYPKAGLFDSEAKQAIALFFVINFDPTIYSYFRYYDISDLNTEVEII